MHLNVFACQSCFVHCKGCYSHSREEKKGRQMPTDKLIEFLEFAYNKGTKKVTFCGGDPLAREDIIELLEKTKNIGFNISLDTVGTPIIKNIISKRGKSVKQINAKKLADCVDVIGIPIDGSTNEVFKLFRQTKSDIVSEQLAICEELRKAGANICINTVAHKGNLEDANELAKLIKKLEYINKWQVFQYQPLGKFGAMNRKAFEITHEQFLNFKASVLEVFNDNKSKVQFKSYSDRKNAYMLIDNSGNAWIPSDEIMSQYKFSYNLDRNKIIGNINNQDDWATICSYLDRDFEPQDKLSDISADIPKIETGVRESFINTISNNGKYRNLLPLKNFSEQQIAEEKYKEKQPKCEEGR